MASADKPWRVGLIVSVVVVDGEGSKEVGAGVQPTRKKASRIKLASLIPSEIWTAGE
jgi:hypothetical protein